MQPEYWGMSLDEISEEIYQIENDGAGGHYIAFAGDRATARQKMIAAFTALIDEHLYRASSYGSPYSWEEELADESL
jgi:hypothetical protein